LASRILEIFHETYRELRPRAPMPAMQVRFYPFANINNTIRLRQGELKIRLSDLLEGAPESILQAIAHILLAKLYRKQIEPLHATRYRRYTNSRELTEKAHLVRQMRGRKNLHGTQGSVYDLEEIFEDLNRRFFFGLMARPQLTWSNTHSRRRLGHYDPAHNAIVISKIFDHAGVPRYAIEYLLYHEMLHLKHPVKLRGSRRCVHGMEFQAEEKLFPQLGQALTFLKQL
jgi:predicted metal-dependent hydrolase